MPPIGERLAKLEGAVDGLQHGQTQIMALLGVGFAVVVAFMLYMLTRIDSLPGDFERLNQTLSSAITAAKQQQVIPQIIYLVPPAIPAQQPTPAPALKPEQ